MLVTRSLFSRAWPRRAWGLVGFLLSIFLLKALLTTGHAETPPRAAPTRPDYTSLSLEELLNIEVTSVAKKAQKRTEAAAAIFVITQEDIRRSGVTSLPEALRLAPGVEVARLDANKWAISIRGFNTLFANKLLVLMDGRSVYNPLFSGVYWDVQDTLLDDVERIEVIRGPGAALWGANAVNGIVNIITKHARDTQGGLLSAGGGTEERGFGGVRYGAQLADDTYVRGYAKYFQRDGLVDPAGQDTPDAWHMGRGGMRLDWQASSQDAVTVQGDVYRGAVQERRPVATLLPPFMSTIDNRSTLFGANVLARWQHTFTTTSLATLQLYYDRTERLEDILEERRDTVDVDMQHQFTLGARQALVWGLGYRFTGDDTRGSFSLAFVPAKRDTHLLSAFVQDDVRLIPQRLRLTLGSKFEYNDYTGFEVQPNARLLWTPQTQHTVWAAVARAVRTPSRTENDFRLRTAIFPPRTTGNPGPLPAALTLLGNADVASEKVLAYELGYRFTPVSSLSFDVAAFYNIYKDFLTFEPGQPFVENSPTSAALFTIPLHIANKQRGEAFGVELVAAWQPWTWWRLQAVYSYLNLRLRLAPDSRDTLRAASEGSSPQHQASLRSSLDLPWHLALDLWLRYVDALPSLNVRSYTTFDLRLAWRPFSRFEVALVGQNLPSGHASELTDRGLLPVDVQRSVYGKVTWQF